MKQLDFVDQAGKEPAEAPAAGQRRSATRQKRRNRPAGSREDMQRLNMEIPRSLHKRLKLKAIYEERTVTDLVLQAVHDYLNSH
ncbi:MAG: hypothetical protein ACOY33_04200 [Pseudomonadota bacterium]